MSLLNQMLQDLDQRRAAHSERQGMPQSVKPLPAVQRKSSLPLIVSVAVLAAAAAGGGWWWVAKQVPKAVPAPAPIPVPPQAPKAIVPVPAAVAEPPAAVAPVLSPAPAPAPLVAPAAVQPTSSKPASGKSASSIAVESPREAEPRASAKPAMPGDARTVARAEGTSGRVEKKPAQSSVQMQAESEYRRAVNLLNQGAVADGEQALAQALRLTPEHAPARQALFNLFLEQRRTDEARTLLDEGLQILPGHTTWAMNLARLQMEKGNVAGAWATLQRSLPMAGANGDYQAFCGTVLQRLNRSPEAIPYFHNALRINPAEGRWWLGLGLALESSGHPAEAREAFVRAKSVGNLSPELAAYADQKSRQQ